LQCTCSVHAVYMQCTCSVHAVQPDASRPFAPLLTRAGPRRRVGLLPGPRAAHRGLAAHAQAALLRRSTLNVPLLQRPMRPTPPLRKPTRLLRAALAREGRLCCLGAGERLLCCLPSVTDSTALSHPIPPPLATQAHCVSRAASRSPPRCAPPRHALSK